MDITGGAWNLGAYGANFTTSTTGGRWTIDNTGTEEAAMLMSVDPAEGWGVSSEGEGGTNKFGLRETDEDGLVITTTGAIITVLESAEDYSFDLWYSGPDENSTSLQGYHSHSMVVTAMPPPEQPVLPHIIMNEGEAEEYVLYIHPTDLGSMAWGPNDNTTGATSYTDGAGNTAMIVADQGDWNDGVYAAKVCYNLEAYGYSDWYLPARDELKAISAAFNFGGVNTIEMGDFEEDWEDFETFVGPPVWSSYWSSTEIAVNGADAVYFNWPGDHMDYNKDYATFVRAVRRDE